MYSKIKKNPEVLFLLSVVFYWFSTAVILNPVAITFLLLGLIMMTRLYKMLSVIIGIIYGLLNFYLVFALLSEFYEFPNVTGQAIYMMFVGSAFISFNMFISVNLIINNIGENDSLHQAIE